MASVGESRFDRAFFEFLKCAADRCAATAKMRLELPGQMNRAAAAATKQVNLAKAALARGESFSQILPFGICDEICTLAEQVWDLPYFEFRSGALVLEHSIRLFDVIETPQQREKVVRVVKDLFEMMLSAQGKIVNRDKSREIALEMNRLKGLMEAHLPKPDQPTQAVAPPSQPALVRGVLLRENHFL